MNKSVLSAVNRAIVKNASEKINDTILTGIITYKYILKIISIDDGSLSNLESLALSYSKSFKETVQNMKNTYVSYAVISSKLEKYGVKSFLQITDDIIDEIYKLYLDKSLIKPFSISKYDPNIYSISNINWESNERLRKIHYNVMVPLIKYYIGNNGLVESDMKIHSALVFSETPGKGILFNINGIGVSRILTDIKKPSLGISKYIYKAQSYENMVLIILR